MHACFLACMCMGFLSLQECVCVCVYACVFSCMHVYGISQFTGVCVCVCVYAMGP